MSLESYLAFCVAATALALVPGPTVTVIIANSLRFGTRAGLTNVLGTQAGFLIWLAIAVMGLGAAVKLMGVWFVALRWLGAVCLIWLGIKMFRSKGVLSLGEQRGTGGNFFLQGFIVIISNPKMLVLFGAMIPPFLSKDGNMMQETLLLGLTFMAIAGIGDTAYAVLAGRAGKWLSHSRVRAIEIVSGICLTAGGLWLALRAR
jgi:threonine/homoserine/homoserine lactone efflux protein